MLDKIVQVLKEVERDCPELRIGQFIDNALSTASCSLFYMSNENLYIKLRTHLTEIQNGCQQLKLDISETHKKIVEELFSHDG